MNKKILAAIGALKKIYPDAGCTLNWGTPLDLLVATILSAQCTDKRVNAITSFLFAKYPTIDHYLATPLAQLERDIHSCGTFRTKAKFIKETCAMIKKKFNGKVPSTMKDLIQLPGVGRKTAAVVLSTVFGKEEGIAVDTHVMRVSQHLGLTKQKTQKKIEEDLMLKTPRKYWSLLSHLLIAHGRAVCTARSPRCAQSSIRFTCLCSCVK